MKRRNFVKSSTIYISLSSLLIPKEAINLLSLVLPYGADPVSEFVTMKSAQGIPVQNIQSYLQELRPKKLPPISEIKKIYQVNNKKATGLTDLSLSLGTTGTFGGIALAIFGGPVGLPIYFAGHGVLSLFSGAGAAYYGSRANEACDEAFRRAEANEALSMLRKNMNEDEKIRNSAFEHDLVNSGELLIEPNREKQIEFLSSKNSDIGIEEIRKIVNSSKEDSRSEIEKFINVKVADISKKIDKYFEELREEQLVAEKAQAQNVLFQESIAFVTAVTAKFIGYEEARVLSGLLNTGLKAYSAYFAVGAAIPGVGWVAAALTVASRLLGLFSGNKRPDPNGYIKIALENLEKRIIDVQKTLHFIEKNQQNILFQLEKIIHDLQDIRYNQGEIQYAIAELGKRLNENISTYFQELEQNEFLDSPTLDLERLHLEKYRGRKIKKQEVIEVRENLNRILNFAIEHTDSPQYSNFPSHSIYLTGKDYKEAIFPYAPQFPNEPHNSQQKANLYQCIAGTPQFYFSITGESIDEKIPHLHLFYQSAKILMFYQYAFPELRKKDYGDKFFVINTLLKERTSELIDTLNKVAKRSVIKQGLELYRVIVDDIIQEMHAVMYQNYRNRYKWSGSANKRDIQLLSSSKETKIVEQIELDKNNNISFEKKVVYRDGNRYLADSERILEQLLKDFRILDVSSKRHKIKTGLGHIKLNEQALTTNVVFFKKDNERLYRRNPKGRGLSIPEPKVEIIDFPKEKTEILIVPKIVSIRKGKFKGYEFEYFENINISHFNSFVEEFNPTIPSSGNVYFNQISYNNLRVKHKDTGGVFGMPKRINPKNKKIERYSDFVKEFNKYPKNYHKKNKNNRMYEVHLRGIQNIGIYKEKDFSINTYNKLSVEDKKELKTQSITWRDQLKQKYFEINDTHINESDFFKPEETIDGLHVFDFLVKLLQEEINSSKIDLVSEVIELYHSKQNKPTRLRNLFDRLDQIGSSLLALFSLNVTITSEKITPYEANYQEKIFNVDDLLTILSSAANSNSNDELIKKIEGLDYSLNVENEEKTKNEIVTLKKERFIDFLLLWIKKISDETISHVQNNIKEILPNDAEPLLANIYNDIERMNNLD